MIRMTRSMSPRIRRAMAAMLFRDSPAAPHGAEHFADAHRKNGTFDWSVNSQRHQCAVPETGGK